MTTCTTRLHLHHETCWWRTHCHVPNQIYQNATSSHIYNTLLKWNMEIDVDEEITSAPAISQQRSISLEPYIHLLLLWSDMGWVFSSIKLPATYSPELTTCTTRLPLHHETCWWRTQWHVPYQIYQNPTSPHIFHILLRWKLEIVVDEESTSAPVSSQQHSISVQPYLHLLLWNDMSGVSRQHDIFTWYRSDSLMFSSPYDKQEIGNEILEKVINQWCYSAPLNFQHIQPTADNVFDTSSSPSWNMLMKNPLTCTISNITKRHVITHIQHSIEMKYGNRCWWRKYLGSSQLPAIFNISSVLPTFAAMKWYVWGIKAQ